MLFVNPSFLSLSEKQKQWKLSLDRLNMSRWEPNKHGVITKVGRQQIDIMSHFWFCSGKPAQVEMLISQQAIDDTRSSDICQMGRWRAPWIRVTLVRRLFVFQNDLIFDELWHSAHLCICLHLREIILTSCCGFSCFNWSWMQGFRELALCYD